MLLIKGGDAKPHVVVDNAFAFFLLLGRERRDGSHDIVGSQSITSYSLDGNASAVRRKEQKSARPREGEAERQMVVGRRNSFLEYFTHMP